MAREAPTRRGLVPTVLPIFNHFGSEKGNAMGNCGTRSHARRGIRALTAPRLGRDRATQTCAQADCLRARRWWRVRVDPRRAVARARKDRPATRLRRRHLGRILNATIVAETPEIAHDRLAAFWSLVTREDVFGSARKMMVNLAALRPAIADPTHCARCCCGPHHRVTSATCNFR